MTAQKKPSARDAKTPFGRKFVTPLSAPEIEPGINKRRYSFTNRIAAV